VLSIFQLKEEMRAHKLDGRQHRVNAIRLVTAKRRGTAIVKEDFGIDNKVQKVRLVFAVWASVFIVLNGALERLYSMSALV
jgi:hypothetical protein